MSNLIEKLSTYKMIKKNYQQNDQALDFYDIIQRTIFYYLENEIFLHVNHL